MAEQSMFDTIAGLAFYLMLVAVGFGSIIAATVFVHRRLRERGWRDAPLAWCTIGAALVAFLGGWLIFDLYWTGRAIFRSLRPSIR
jgi:hypothetical protein